jgi:hypothetical protein
MAAPRRRKLVLPSNIVDDPGEELPYTVELWSLTRAAVERVLGRASSATLGQAIFLAARNEHLGRKITLKHGDKVLAESN